MKKDYTIAVAGTGYQYHKEDVRMILKRRHLLSSEKYISEVKKLVDIEECRKIFEMYYNAPCNIEEDIFKNLIEYIEQNILFIELVAKTARYAEMPLNDYIKEIVSTGLSISEDEIYSSYDRKTDNLINRLKHLYTLQKMTVEEQEVLEKFALTPNLYVPFQYREWAGIKKDKLIALINRGWIDKSEEGYKMHPLIKESIIQQEVINISNFEELMK